MIPDAEGQRTFEYEGKDYRIHDRSNKWTFDSLRSSREVAIGSAISPS